jgi:hypothetical protein
VWGLDEHGFFKTAHGNGAVLQQLKAVLALCKRGGGGSSASTVDVADRLMMDLKDVHTSLLVEKRLDTERTRSNKEKGKHLLFLFQRDLLPGVSGKILESKGQRDNIAVKSVSWQAKAAGFSCSPSARRCTGRERGRCRS